MKLDARTLRERRKQRIAARTNVQADDMPQWLEDKIEDDEAEGQDADPGDEGVPMDEDADMMDDEALGAFRYNPVYQKPTHLGSDKPSGGYHYYGPLPDAGTSYGYYVDQEHDLGIITPRSKAAYSPLSGKPMRYQGAVGIEGLASVLSVANQMTALQLGKEQRYCSAPLAMVTTTKLFDVMSGQDASAALKALGEDYGMDDMEGQDEDVMDDDYGMDDMEGQDEDVMDDDDVMDMDDMTEGQDEDVMDDDDVMDMDDMTEGQDDAVMDDDDVMDMDDMTESQDDAVMDDDVMDDMEGQDEDEPMEEPVEELDMELMEEEPAESMEMPMMPPPAMAPAQDEEEELDVEEDEADDVEEEEAVTYEALTSVDELDGEPISEADVHMTLFNEEDPAGNVSANPYWNIDVKGQPVARVYLQDQPKPEEIRRVFCAADYHRGVSEAIEKAGLTPVLRKLNAKVWANKVEETKLAQRIRTNVEADANRRVTALTQNLMKDLLHRIAVVCAGMDKNFYREEGNPLKEALWAELHHFGIANPSAMIEAGFRKGSTPYFQTVIKKAVEYMEMDPKALAQVQQAIGDADVLPAGDAVVGDDLPDATPDGPESMPTLSQRLAASSVAIGGLPALSGDALGDHKRALRDELRLGGAGPQLRRR